jgi:asparaginyl-tRNA synthetase
VNTSEKQLIQRTKIRQIKFGPEGQEAWVNREVTIKGWIRTVRDQKTFTFVEVNDGSTLSNLQVIIDDTTQGFDPREAVTGASVSITGVIVASPAKGQAVEMRAKEFTLVGGCPQDSYPLQKKRHSFEFLRTIAHLRPRTNTLGALARVRNQMAFAVHRFFQERGFLYVHSPIITASDCEGAGELFSVSTLDFNKIPKNEEGKVDYTKDFFGKPAYLTVSGQLNAETYACALSDVYTFGPTFRAENSNTARHLAEFWMIEPEMAFATIQDDMDNAEAFIKYVLKSTLENNPEELEFFEQFISKGLIENLKKVVETPFERISYTYAVRILERSGKKFQFPVKWGIDLQTEHERFLAEEFFNKPVIITDYPKEIKAFYMRRNDDNKTVAAMDILVPKIGEIVGGSQREERIELLQERMRELNMKEEDLWWYLDLRRYGSIPHAGYGVGFERLIQFATGMENIRDVIPFARVPGTCEF